MDLIKSWSLKEKIFYDINQYLKRVKGNLSALYLYLNK